MLHSADSVTVLTCHLTAGDLLGPDESTATRLKKTVDRVETVREVKHLPEMLLCLSVQKKTVFIF